MGADGHISIWRRDRVLERFPDCEELFSQLSSHYLHSLDGVLYDHLYHGDNYGSYWWDEREWFGVDEAMKERLKVFVEWLEDNATRWEVWT